MIKYNLLVMVLILLVSCNAKKTIIQTSIKENNKANSVSKSATKTIANRSVIQSNRNANSQILEATSRVNVTNEIILKYIDTYKDVAQYNMKKYGIPASIILGQAILESGSGTGNLCVQANNHFGIKCHNDWIGESIKYDDDAKDECFRKYDKGADSFRDHSLFLTTRSRYAELFQLKATDYQSWANGLKAVGAFPFSRPELIPKILFFNRSVESILSIYSSIWVLFAQSSTKNAFKFWIGCLKRSVIMANNLPPILSALTIGAIKRRQNPDPAEYLTGSTCLFSSRWMIEPIAIPSERFRSFLNVVTPMRLSEFVLIP